MCNELMQTKAYWFFAAHSFIYSLDRHNTPEMLWTKRTISEYIPSISKTPPNM